MASYQLPTKPYSVIDAINRYAAATGSCRYAQAAGDADYNGHNASLRWNEYHQAWQGYYIWGGIVYLLNASSHLSTEKALQTMRRWYDGQGRGASVGVSLEGAPAEQVAEFEALAEKYGFVLVGEDEPVADWVKWQHGSISDIFWHQEKLGVPIALALKCSSKAEWERQVEALIAERRGQRKAVAG